MSTFFESIDTAEIEWRNGQPYSITFNDIYFSAEGGLGEAKHVFIDGNRLIERWRALDRDDSSFVIAETGFGSGLNFLLSWSLWKKYAPPCAKLFFISSEQYPLTPLDLLRCSVLWPDLAAEASALIAEYPVLTPGFHQLSFDEGRVHLTLMIGEANQCFQELLHCGDLYLERDIRDGLVDAWYLDGFSPSKNPLMWSESLFRSIAMLSKIESTLATYTASGLVKQRLYDSGFKVMKQRGYGCKRDMLIAVFQELKLTRGLRNTPWHVSPVRRVRTKQVLVIGAGLAGCYMAHALARRGWKVILLDTYSKIGAGASGNHQAVLFPQLSPFYSPLNGFMLSAYLYAVRAYKPFLKQSPLGNLSGILQMAHNDKEQARQMRLRPWLLKHKSLGQWVDAAQASAIAGIPLHQSGLYIPASGWIDLPKLCQALVQSKNIECVTNEDVKDLEHHGKVWAFNGYEAEVVILSAGAGTKTFTQTSHLPLKKIRGQMTSILATPQSQCLKVPLCAEGHILPMRDGLHAIGATYHPGAGDSSCSAEDDEENLLKLKAIQTDISWSQRVIEHWAGIRVAAPDYLPIVGPVAKAELFKHAFEGLGSNPNRWIPRPGVYHDGLYVCTAFGSRGLTSIPLSAEWLAGMINQEPSCMPRTMVQSISPARFLRRDLVRMTPSFG